ncbi:hypothetical protein M1N79_03440 [Dehalococcoidia bacterium]|nr:hypothetical protein [Dehalococcoidia bacterium]
MLVCKVCGKKFKSKEALGGHMSGAHPQNNANNMPKTNAPKSIKAEGVEESSQNFAEGVVEAVSEEPSQSADEGPGRMESIRKLREQGYSAGQIKEDFGYAHSTVDQVFAEFIEPEAELDQGKEQETMPAVYEKDDRPNPEVLLRRYVDGSYEDELEPSFIFTRVSYLLVIQSAYPLVGYEWVAMFR